MDWAVKVVHKRTYPEIVLRQFQDMFLSFLAVKTVDADFKLFRAFHENQYLDKC